MSPFFLKKNNVLISPQGQGDGDRHQAAPAGGRDRHADRLQVRGDVPAGDRGLCLHHGPRLHVLADQEDGDQVHNVLFFSKPPPRFRTNILDDEQELGSGMVNG